MVYFKRKTNWQINYATMQQYELTDNINFK